MPRTGVLKMGVWIFGLEISIMAKVIDFAMDVKISNPV
jgi:hypothetical protein